MTCLCGHLQVHHATRRGRCLATVRMHLSKRVGIPPGDIVLEKKEAEQVVNEAFEKVEKAPSYQRQFEALLKRGFVKIDCQCKLYHEVEIPDDVQILT